MNRHSPFRISTPLFTIATSCFLVLAYNHAFWQRFLLAIGGFSPARLPLLAATFVLLVLVCNACLSLLNFRPVIKPFVMGLLVLTSVAACFMDQYGVQIDRSMMQNVMETDSREAAELLSVNMLCTIGALGIAPALLVSRLPLTYARGWRALLGNAGIAAGSLALAAAIVIVFFKSYAPALREHRELRFLLTPSNYLQAVHGYVKQKLARPAVVAPLGTDAARGITWRGQARRTVTVIVVGETARAMNFSLNGYARDTNPRLARRAGLVNFSHMSSCGTATAVSVPCVFSALGRDGYSDGKAQSQEGLLDVLRHAGLDVLWIDNNSGCKGVCARVAFDDVSRPAPGDPLCNGEECYDEKLLQALPDTIRNARNDQVIVLHQKGSHGPAYWKRYPAAFSKFGPVCASADLEQCTREQITAAYDNTILYTDYVLDEAIGMLERVGAEAGVDTALMYFSDHGESLGENNLYLHGAPYVIAPPEQRSVPFMLWMSGGYAQRFRIERGCVAARAGQAYSHDHVFHSVLGMLDIGTAVYNPALDLFNACTHGGAVAN